MRRITLAALALGLGLARAPAPARANGGNSHAWITFHAVEHLPDGALKRLLTRPELQVMLLNGAVFPDGGYVVGDDYGELAHWEPFVTAYIDWMATDLERPFTEGGAAEHVAFLMGVASHGMADQVFDATFMDAARIYDAAGWSDDLLDSFDTATDVMLVAATGLNYLGFEPWVPAEELSALYRDAFGYPIGAADLDGAQDLLHRLVLAYGVSQASDPDDLADYEARYAWAAGNLMDDTVVGSPPCEGEVVAAYFLALWDRLHDASGPQNRVIATYPRDGADGHPTDHALVESQVIIVSGHGIYRDELAAHIAVTDATGHTYDVAVTTQWGAREANLIRIRPREDWAADQTFTVTVAPGLTTLDGLTYDEPFTLTFSTRPASGPIDPTGDPTPHAGEPDLGLPRPPSSGCAVATADDGAMVVVVLGLAALARLRRRRGQTRASTTRKPR